MIQLFAGAGTADGAPGAVALEACSSPMSPSPVSLAEAERIGLGIGFSWFVATTTEAAGPGGSGGFCRGLMSWATTVTVCGFGAGKSPGDADGAALEAT